MQYRVAARCQLRPRPLRSLWDEQTIRTPINVRSKVEPPFAGGPRPQRSDRSFSDGRVRELTYGGRSHPALDAAIAKEGQIFSSQNGVERYAILWRLPKRDVAFIRRSSSTFAATRRCSPPSRAYRQTGGNCSRQRLDRLVASEKRRADWHRQQLWTAEFWRFTMFSKLSRMLKGPFHSQSHARIY
jgi:hypothetical protein